MSTIWFTSDTHIGHHNILKHSKRLQFCNNLERDIILNGTPEDIKALRISDESLHRMDDTIVSNWNSLVQPEDVVYHLGDFFVRVKNKEYAREILRKLNGSIHFIAGNHKSTDKRLKDEFTSYNSFGLEIKVDDPEANLGVQEITLCHYGMRVWNKSHRGAWQLYGHSHGSLFDDPNSKSFDVGIDCWDYKPINYSQVKAKMATKTFIPVDHHH